MATVKMFRDAEGGLRAEWNERPLRGEYLVRFLEGDLAADENLCGRFIDDARNVATGKMKTALLTGNAFTVKMTPKFATLYFDADDRAKPFSLPLAEFAATVKRWRKFIAGK